jgi:hypothetical protein
LVSVVVPVEIGLELSLIVGGGCGDGDGDGDGDGLGEGEASGEEMRVGSARRVTGGRSVPTAAFAVASELLGWRCLVRPW